VALVAQLAFVEAGDSDKIFRPSVRHLDHVHNAAQRFVIAVARADRLSAAQSVIERKFEKLDTSPQRFESLFTF
jgi:hypothetical protein